MTSDSGSEITGSPAESSSPPAIAAGSSHFGAKKLKSLTANVPTSQKLDPPRIETCRQVKPRPSGLIVSKQWVLPPRPRPGRKPKPKPDPKMVPVPVRTGSEPTVMSPSAPNPDESRPVPSPVPASTSLEDDSCILCSRDECMCANIGLKSEGKRTSIPSLDMILNATDIKMDAVPLKRPAIASNLAHSGPKPKFMRIAGEMSMPSPTEGLRNFAEGCGFCTEDTPCACASAEASNSSLVGVGSPREGSPSTNFLGSSNVPKRPSVPDERPEHSLHSPHSGHSTHSPHPAAIGSPRTAHMHSPQQTVHSGPIPDNVHPHSAHSHGVHSVQSHPPHMQSINASPVSTQSHPHTHPANMLNAPFNTPFPPFNNLHHPHSPGPPSPLPHPPMVPAPMMYPVPGYHPSPAPLMHSPHPASVSPVASPQMSPNEDEDYGCASCQKDAMSMLFCVSLKSAKPLAPGAVAIPCHLAVKTLQKHPKFSTCDLGRLIRKLEVRGKQVGVQSINRALQDLEHPT